MSTCPQVAMTQSQRSGRRLHRLSVGLGPLPKGSSCQGFWEAAFFSSASQIMFLGVRVPYK